MMNHPIVYMSKAHYVDDYRYFPGRTLCGKYLTTQRVHPSGSQTNDLCKICNHRKELYPDEDWWFDFQCCTDCGKFSFNENAFLIKTKIWEIAYPGYSSGVGVGNSRPCILCLEKRLGRMLSKSDFANYPINTPHPDYSELLNDRLMRE